MRKTPRIKQEPLFRRRILITIPPWGVPVIALGIGVGLWEQSQMLYEAICTILVASCLIGAAMMYTTVQEARHQIHNILHDMENENVEPPAVEVKAESNGHSNARISVKR